MHNIELHLDLPFQGINTVSYTHLDVYKRQRQLRPALAHPSQFPAASPAVRPYPVVQRVPYPVTGYRPSVVARQLVVPLCVPVAIRNRLQRRPQRPRRIRVLLLLPDVSPCVVAPRPALPQPLVVLPHQLSSLVVHVPRVVPSPRVVRDLPVAIVSR